MATVLGSELVTRIKGLRVDLCKVRDDAGFLVTGIDKLLESGKRTANPILQDSASRMRRLTIQKAAKSEGKTSGIVQEVLALLESDGPASTPSILTKLAERGHNVKGKRPIQTLYGVLHKDSKSATPRIRRKGKLWATA